MFTPSGSSLILMGSIKLQLSFRTCSNCGAPQQHAFQSRQSGQVCETHQQVDLGLRVSLMNFSINFKYYFIWDLTHFVLCNQYTIIHILYCPYGDGTKPHSFQHWTLGSYAPEGTQFVRLVPTPNNPPHSSSCLMLVAWSKYKPMLSKQLRTIGWSGLPRDLWMTG